MKRLIVRSLLSLLNSRWLNHSPCEYGFIGNVDAFSYSHLASEEKQRPGITVRTILEEADRFRSCPMGGRVTVLEADGTSHEATAWDLHELRVSLTPTFVRDQPHGATQSKEANKE